MTQASFMMNELIKKIVLIFLISTFFFSFNIAAEEQLHIWIKAFIPNKHPELPNYFQKTSKNTWAIQAPILPLPFVDVGKLSGTCFLTDNRGFDSDPKASARVSVELLLTIDKRKIQLSKYLNNEIVVIGQTENVDCSSGEQLRIPERANVNTVTIGEFKTSPGSSFIKTLNIKASSPNPYYKILNYQIAPDIDFEVVIQYSITRRVVKVIGTTGYFPSFEAYYSLNGQAPRPIVQLPPYKNSTAMELFDMNLGLNKRNFEAEIPIN